MAVKVQDVDLRRNLVADLYLRGHSFRSISDVLKKEHSLATSHITVFNDVKVLREQWKVERMEAYETSLATELEKLDKVEVAAWSGWDKSKEEDPRFLAIITKVSEQRGRLLGLFQKEEKNQNDAAVPTGQLPAAFTESPTFVVVGGTMDMIENEDDLPEDED